jgi:hypothetical protein
MQRNRFSILDSLARKGAQGSHGMEFELSRKAAKNAQENNKRILLCGLCAFASQCLVAPLGDFARKFELQPHASAKMIT